MKDAEDLIEYFSLTQDERNLLYQWRKDANTVGFAVLLKSFQFLGYPPRQKEDIPDAIISCISRQLKLDARQFNRYRWKDSVWKVYLSSIREFTGFRPGGAPGNRCFYPELGSPYKTVQVVKKMLGILCKPMLSKLTKIVAQQWASENCLQNLIP
ncbi:MAG: DUF4158 domain-containing protein [Deltaproteobacteria bacterium]|jgi:hypothetical protein|nr:DUF4158 domain-containing protein [Deltaproteobacteria bacterium]